MVQQVSMSPREVFPSPLLSGRKSRLRVYPQISSWGALNEEARRDSLPDSPKLQITNFNNTCVTPASALCKTRAVQHAVSKSSRSTVVALVHSEENNSHTVFTQHVRPHCSVSSPPSTSIKSNCISSSEYTNKKKTNTFPSRSDLTGHHFTEVPACSISYPDCENHYIKLKKKVNFSQTCCVYPPVNNVTPTAPLLAHAKVSCGSRRKNQDQMKYSEFQVGNCSKDIRVAQTIPIELLNCQSTIYGSAGIIPQRCTQESASKNFTPANLTHPLPKYSAYGSKKISINKTLKHPLPYEPISRLPNLISKQSTNYSLSSKVGNSQFTGIRVDIGKAVHSNAFPKFSSISKASFFNSVQSDVDQRNLPASYKSMPNKYNALQPIIISSGAHSNSINKNSKVPDCFGHSKQLKTTSNIANPGVTSAFMNPLSQNVDVSPVLPGIGISRSSTFSLGIVAPSVANDNIVSCSSASCSSSDTSSVYDGGSSACQSPVTPLPPASVADLSSSGHGINTSQPKHQKSYETVQSRQQHHQNISKSKSLTHEEDMNNLATNPLQNCNCLIKPTCSTPPSQKRCKTSASGASHDKRLRYGRFLTEDDVKEFVVAPLLKEPDDLVVPSRTFNNLIGEAKRLMSLRHQRDVLSLEQSSPYLYITPSQDNVTLSSHQIELSKDKVC